MSQDKALEGSNPRDELKAINAAIAAHIATADAINPVGGAAVRHSDEDQTSGQVGGEEVDPEVVDHLDHAKRLGGLEAAAFALWWLEEGSNTGLHFDQAFVEFTELAKEVKEDFLRRATLLMHSHNPQDAVGGRRSTGHHPAVGHVVESGKVEELAKREHAGKIADIGAVLGTLLGSSYNFGLGDLFSLMWAVLPSVGQHPSGQVVEQVESGEVAEPGTEKLGHHAYSLEQQREESGDIGAVLATLLGFSSDNFSLWDLLSTLLSDTDMLSLLLSSLTQKQKEVPVKRRSAKGGNAAVKPKKKAKK